MPNEIEDEDVMKLKALKDKAELNQLRALAHPTPGRVLWGFLMLYFTICCIIWQWRNPTANPMTCLNRINHVVCFDKLPEFQVVDSVHLTK